MGNILIIIGIVEALFVLKLSNISIKHFKKYIPIAGSFFMSTMINYIIISQIEFVKSIMEISEGIWIEEISVFLVSMAIAILCGPIYVPLIQKNHEKNVIKNYEKTIEVMEYEYYRDIIKDISPAILMFIHNKKINVKDCVVATLLDLELKKYIKIENEKVIILKDISELLSFEQLVLQRNNYDEKTFKKLFIESLMSQLVKQRYINKKAKKYDISEDHHIEKMKDKSNIAYFMELPIAWMVIYMLSIFALITGANLVVAVFMIVAYITAFLCIPIYNFIQNRIIVIIRTEKALELAAKIKGIKNYIVDYSNIKNSGIEMVKLYEEFVIYAIILDIKGNLNNECKELYENIKNKVVIKELK